MARSKRRGAVRSFWLLSVIVLLGSAFNITGSSAEAPVIKVVSNRADLISGGDALIEVVLPQQVASAMSKTAAVSSLLDVRLNGIAVTKAFDVVDGIVAGAPAPRLLGKVEGLKMGKNVLSVSLAGGQSARITLTNHSITGPIFGGPQVTPWICSTEESGLGPALDAKCSGKTVYGFLYKSTDPLSSGLQDYDPANPPSDVATTTTDQGATVPFIVRNERGTIDRGIYDIAILYDPSKPWTPTAPQAGWNGKVVYPFGGSCGPFHLQTANSGAVLDENALSRGFAVATSGLNVLGNNCNEAVSAESLMMVKEHLAETYGPIRYTIGNGCSGGSIQQVNIASAYPGLLDGILPSCTFTDVATTAIEVLECRMMLHYFNEVSPHLWGLLQQRAFVAGHMSPSLCHTWITVYGFDRQGGDPTWGCTQPVLNAVNLPYIGPIALPGSSEPEWVYDPKTNPKGTRCTIQDYSVATFGRRPDGFARRPGDNVGVQYGLQALESGLILPDQFVDLNEKIGGLDIDLGFTSERLPADPGGTEAAYQAGRVSDGKALATTPIIDIRGHNNNEIHADFYSYTLRERLLKANGSLGNYALFVSPLPLVPLPQVSDEAFLLMDEWLANIEKDASAKPRAVKVAENRPAGAVDSCWVGLKKVTDWTICQTLFPHFTSPRVNAGGPIANDVLKCQTKPLRREDYSVAFSDAQWTRLEGAFPTGVCDWSKPGVGQRPGIPWATFANGPGGSPLSAAPASSPVTGAAAFGEAAVLSEGVRRGAPAELPATGVGSAGSALLGAAGLTLAAVFRRVLRRA
ncbi:MAG: DUF6351 family protein [Actinomycetota bacterium]